MKTFPPKSIRVLVDNIPSSSSSSDLNGHPSHPSYLSPPNFSLSLRLGKKSPYLRLVPLYSTLLLLDKRAILARRKNEWLYEARFRFSCRVKSKNRIIANGTGKLEMRTNP